MFMNSCSQKKLKDETMCEKHTSIKIINERRTSESATHDGWLLKGSSPSLNGFEQADNFLLRKKKTM